MVEKKVLNSDSQNPSSNKRSSPQSRSPSPPPKKTSKTVAKVEMCHFCLRVLHAYLEGGMERVEKVPDPVEAFADSQEFGVFVTYKKLKDNELRGCRGILAPSPLYQSLREMALKSAIKDSRFQPVKDVKELKTLRITVSILYDFERGFKAYDWNEDVHGIEIFFPDPTISKKAKNNSYSNYLSATFLPHIGTEHGWNKFLKPNKSELPREVEYFHQNYINRRWDWNTNVIDRTIRELIRKAGYHGKITPDIIKSIDLRRYKTDCASCTFTEYLKYSSSCNNSPPAVSPPVEISEDKEEEFQSSNVDSNGLSDPVET